MLNSEEGKRSYSIECWQRAQEFQSYSAEESSLPGQPSESLDFRKYETSFSNMYLSTQVW